MPGDLYTIPPGADFLRLLARGLWRLAAGDPAQLAQQQIFLPTRRAARALTDALREAAPQRALLLPGIRTLGQLEADDEDGHAAPAESGTRPAIAPPRRAALLARELMRTDPARALGAALAQAEDLARFLDRVQIERCDPAALPSLLEESDLAAHWQRTVDFLQLIFTRWPKILAEERAQDPVPFQQQHLAALCRRWRESPPGHPVVAAGTTASAPATAELLGEILALPQGCVVLPGLDTHLPDAAWQELPESHAQYGLAQLLRRLQRERHSIPPWPEAAPAASATPDFWSAALSPHFPHPALPHSAPPGLMRLEAENAEEEATAIALALRETLEIPDHTAMLVTPDRTLAQRVRILLRRWGVEVDDSGGTPLARLPVGTLLGRIALTLTEPTQRNRLALLKHPLCHLGRPAAECRVQARAWEMQLRQAQRTPHAPPEILQALEAALAPLRHAVAAALPVADLLMAHLAVMETICTGAEEAWDSTPEGQAARALLEGWAAALDNIPLSFADADEYATWLHTQLQQTSVRPPWPQHPRLTILGQLEARLLHADRIILASLNEGSWPPAGTPDPWLSRPMARRWGLPTPERQIGLAAHDFQQLASAPYVLLTRARRQDGVPTLESRFLARLSACTLKPEGAYGRAYALWAQALDAAPAGRVEPMPRPAPRPPLAVRPKKISASDCALWLQNPYGLYAKKILKLRRLDDLDQLAHVAEFGTFVHTLLEAWTHSYCPATADHSFRTLLAAQLAEQNVPEETVLLWRTRLLAVLPWLLRAEAERRRHVRFLSTEQTWEAALAPGLTIHARADRVDAVRGGGLAILDYKTGSAPDKKKVKEGRAVQLPLEAALALASGAGTPASLSIWKIGSHQGNSQAWDIDENVEELAQKAQDWMRRMHAAFAQIETPYLAIPLPEEAPTYDDYAHLARHAEWLAPDEPGGEA